MTWQDLTIGQYQQILEIMDSDVDNSEMEEKMLNVAGYDSNDLLAMSLKEFAELYEKEFEFLHSEMPKIKPVKVVKSGWRLYKISYDVTKITKGEYDEVLNFSQNGVNKTLHQFMATICKPYFFGKKDHGERSKDMLKVNLLAAYYACVFFWNVYKNLPEAIRTSLEKRAAQQTSSPSTGDGTTITN